MSNVFKLWCAVRRAVLGCTVVLMSSTASAIELDPLAIGLCFGFNGGFGLAGTGGTVQIDGDAEVELLVVDTTGIIAVDGDVDGLATATLVAPPRTLHKQNQVDRKSVRVPIIRRLLDGNTRSANGCGA